MGEYFIWVTEGKQIVGKSVFAYKYCFYLKLSIQGQLSILELCMLALNMFFFNTSGKTLTPTLKFLPFSLKRRTLVVRVKRGHIMIIVAIVVMWYPSVINEREVFLYIQGYCRTMAGAICMSMSTWFVPSDRSCPGRVQVNQSFNLKMLNKTSGICFHPEQHSSSVKVAFKWHILSIHPVGFWQ